jgi:DNA-directed RNA polymerase subunit beta
MIADTASKDTSKSESDGLIELYRRLRPGEIPTDEAVKQHLKNLFFDARRYDLARVGRYKFNKRLRLGERIVGLKAFEDVISGDGEVLATAGQIISKAMAEDIQNAGINVFYADVNGKKHKLIGNNVVSFEAKTGVDPKYFGLLDFVYNPSFEFSKEVAESVKENGVEATAEALKKEINALFYIEDKNIPAKEEKPEDRKNEE